MAFTRGGRELLGPEAARPLSGARTWLEEEPSLLGASAHLLVVAHKA